MMNNPFSLALLSLSLLPAVLADTAEITSHLFSGGGGPAAGGSIELHGSLGQPAVGVSHSGTAALAAGFWTVTLEVAVETGSFETWMANLDPADQPPVDQRGPENTPANDGVVNLVKYAFGLLPLEPAADARPELMSVDGDLALKFVRNPEANVEYTLKGSSDLEAWTEITLLAENSSPLGEGLEAVEMITHHTTGAESRYFLKLNIIKP